MFAYYFGKTFLEAVYFSFILNVFTLAWKCLHSSRDWQRRGMVQENSKLWMHINVGTTFHFEPWMNGNNNKKTKISVCDFVLIWSWVKRSSRFCLGKVKVCLTHAVRTWERNVSAITSTLSTLWVLCFGQSHNLFSFSGGYPIKVDKWEIVKVWKSESVKLKVESRADPKTPIWPQRENCRWKWVQPN